LVAVGASEHFHLMSAQRQLDAAHFTPKNFGFSDAAEILVFLSGLASGSVYGSVARQSGLVTALLRVLRRAFEIYLAQIITVVVLLIQISLLASRAPAESAGSRQSRGLCC
jgi:hypothetical protein